MSQIDLSRFDVEIENEEIDIYDPEIFQMRIESCIEDQNLKDALMEDYDENPNEAWQNLLFWENEYSILEENEWAVAA